MSGRYFPIDPSLRNNLTGVLLGAGASYDLGMPLLWELTHEIKSWLTSEKLRTGNSTGGCSFEPESGLVMTSENHPVEVFDYGSEAFF